MQMKAKRVYVIYPEYINTYMKADWYWLELEMSDGRLHAWHQQDIYCNEKWFSCGNPALVSSQSWFQLQVLVEMLFAPNEHGIIKNRVLYWKD